MAATATMMQETADPPPINIACGTPSGWLDWVPSWKPTSEEMLVEAEKTVMDCVQSDYKDLHVPVGPGIYIHTLHFEPEISPSEQAIPLVMIHGFGCGVAQYYKNYDHLHATRSVYSIDLPGYARSTRVKFTDDGEINENMFVEYLEKWRISVGLEQFILLGHSFGGYLSASYAISYPSRVRHLVLNDPWGLPSRLEELESGRARRFPLWVTVIATVISNFRPFTAVRAAGPAGPYLVKKVRADLASKFGDDFMNYVYHSNVQEPTGENAFFCMQFQYAWAQRPMFPRLTSDLDPSIPITMIYGVRSWMDSSSGERLRESRPNSYVDIHYIKRAGHHLHAEQPEEFNRVVNFICSVVDTNEDQKPLIYKPHRRTDSYEDQDN